MLSRHSEVREPQDVVRYSYIAVVLQWSCWAISVIERTENHFIRCLLKESNTFESARGVGAAIMWDKCKCFDAVHASQCLHAKRNVYVIYYINALFQP